MRCQYKIRFNCKNRYSQDGSVWNSCEVRQCTKQANIKSNVYCTQHQKAIDRWGY